MFSTYFAQALSNLKARVSGRDCCTGPVLRVLKCHGRGLGLMTPRSNLPEFKAPRYLYSFFDTLASSQNKVITSWLILSLQG